MKTKKKYLVLVGGFLGAGKTTLIGRAVRSLQSQGMLCGVITNDQANGLVDTAIGERLDGALVSEIAGGCFCCKLDDLAKVLSEQWSPGMEDTPDVIVGEPVGSCTDLMATVLLPLRRAYGDAIEISPLSVVVDGRRALASLGGKRTPGDFSRDVGYIYRKQIEEAEIVVVNKMDLMREEDLEDLIARISKEYPEKKVRVLSAKTGAGIQEWIDEITGKRAEPRSLMEVDYQRYGEGEALLGWCNADITISGEHEVDGDELLLAIANIIGRDLANQSIEIAHFKMALTDADGRLGTVNQVMSGVDAEVSRSFAASLRNGRITVNLRAEADPERLQKAVEDCFSLAELGGRVWDCRIVEMAAFKPGQPVPVERVRSLE